MLFRKNGRSGGGMAPDGCHADVPGINTGTRSTRDLTGERWKILDPFIPKPRRRRDGRGRRGSVTESGGKNSTLMFAVLVGQRLFGALDRSKNAGILDSSAEVQARASLRVNGELSQRTENEN